MPATDFNPAEYIASHLDAIRCWWSVRHIPHYRSLIRQSIEHARSYRRMVKAERAAFIARAREFLRDARAWRNRPARPERGSWIMPANVGYWQAMGNVAKNRIAASGKAVR